MATRRTRTSSDGQDFLRGVTTALWVPAWASAEEEKGRSFSGQRLEDIAPPPPPSARRAAEQFARAFEQVNGLPLSMILSVLREVEHNADAEEFGYGVAMPALGHGVSWTDDHDAPADLRIPSIEAYADKHRGRWELNVSGLDEPKRLAKTLRDRERRPRRATKRTAKRRKPVRIPPARRGTVSRRVGALVKKGYSPRYAAKRAYAGRDKLSAAEVRALPASAFALPARRALPLADPSHVRNAAARLAQMHKRGTVTETEYRAARTRIDRALKSFPSSARDHACTCGTAPRRRRSRARARRR